MGNGKRRKVLLQSCAEEEEQPQNVVTPHVDVDVNTAWHDIAPPQGAPVPASVYVYLTETHPATAYAGQGVLTCPDGGVGLFLDAACQQPIPAYFSKVQLTQPPPGLRVYARGLAAGATQVRLTLTQSVNPQVVVQPPATAPLTVREVNVATPRLRIVNDTSWVGGAGPAPARFELWMDQSQADPAHSRRAVLKWAPAHLTLHTQPDCGDSAVPAENPLALRDLGSAPFTLYAKGLHAGDVTLSLELNDDGNEGIRLEPAVTQTVHGRPVNVVTPRITITQPDTWFDVTGDPYFVPARLTLSLQESTHDPAYVGTGTLTGTKCRFYTDEGCLNEAVQPFNHQDLTAGVSLYVKPGDVGDDTLTFTLSDPGQPSVMVSPPATAPLRIRPVNVVTPRLSAVSDTSWLGGSGPAPARFELWLEQSQSEPVHSPRVSLGWAPASLSLHQQADCGDTVPAANPLIIEKLGSHHETLYANGLSAGDVTLTLSVEDAKVAGIRLAPAATQLLHVQPVNVVTPHIEAEFDVALVPPPQGLTHPAEPTRIELFLTESVPGQPYGEDADLTWDASRFLLFEDAACTRPVNTPLQLSNGDISRGNRKPLFLRGQAPGLGTLTLTPRPSIAPSVLVGPAATHTMGAVRLFLDLHRDPLAPAPTGVMSDADKVNTGRVLHTQNPAGHHGRARLDVRLDATHWPPGCGNYELVLRTEATTGAIALFSTAAGGVARPVRFTQAAVAGAPQTCWVEGQAETHALRDARVHVDLERPAGGLAATPKRNGDWAALTVVRIDTVTPLPGALHRQYVNLPTTVGQPTYGHVYRSKAKLTQRLPGIRLVFKVVSDPTNVADRPAALVLTPPSPLSSGLTDAQGEVEVDCTLSRYGGDKLKVGVFLAEDATQGDAHPTESQVIEVWRGLYSRYVQMLNPLGGVFAGHGLSPVPFENVMAGQFVEVVRPGGGVPTPAHRHCILTDQATTWLNSVTPPSPLTVRIAFADRLGGPETAFTLSPTGATISNPSLPVSGYVFDLDDPAKPWLVSVECWEQTNPFNRQALLPTEVTLTAAAGNDYTLQMNLTRLLPSGPPTNPIDFEIKLRGRMPVNGVANADAVVLSSHFISQVPTAQDTTTHLLLHEVGHYLGLASQLQANAAGTTPSPNFYSLFGPHCSANGNGCVMYGITSTNTVFCPECSTALRGRNLSAPPVDGHTAGF